MPQAPSTWADYLAGYRWRGQGEGCSAATVHRLEAARRPTLFVKQEVLSAHAELPAEIARLRWLHGAGIDCPQVLNETQSDGRQWLLMSAVPGDTLSALAQRGELEPERLVRLVAAALRRLEERGVIKGYTVEVDPRHFGYQLQEAIVRVRPLPGKLHEVERQIQSIPEFTECDKITGEDCFVARLHVRSMEQLDELLDRINVYAETNTAIVKKTSVPRRLPPMN